LNIGRIPMRQACAACTSARLRRGQTDSVRYRPQKSGRPRDKLTTGNNPGPRTKDLV